MNLGGHTVAQGHTDSPQIILTIANMPQTRPEWGATGIGRLRTQLTDVAPRASETLCFGQLRHRCRDGRVDRAEGSTEGCRGRGATAGGCVPAAGMPPDAGARESRGSRLQRQSSSSVTPSQHTPGVCPEETSSTKY